METLPRSTPPLSSDHHHFHRKRIGEAVKRKTRNTTKCNIQFINTFVRDIDPQALGTALPLRSVRKHPTALQKPYRGPTNYFSGEDPNPLRFLMSCWLLLFARWWKGGSTFTACGSPSNQQPARQQQQQQQSCCSFITLLLFFFISHFCFVSFSRLFSRRRRLLRLCHRQVHPAQ